MHPEVLQTTADSHSRSTRFCLVFCIFCLDKLSQVLHNTTPGDDIASSLLCSPTGPTACSIHAVNPGNTKSYDTYLTYCTKIQSHLASASCSSPCSRVWPGLQSMLCLLGLLSHMPFSQPRSGLTSELRSTIFPNVVMQLCTMLAFMKKALQCYGTACVVRSFMHHCDWNFLLFRKLAACHILA